MFGDCYTYPHITKSSSQNIHLPQSVPEANEQPTPSVKPKVTAKKQAVKRKLDYPKPTAKKQKKQSVKRRVNNRTPAVRKQKKQAVKRKPTKKSKKQSKRKTKKQRKQTVYQSEFNQEEQFRYAEDQFSSDEEQLNYDENDKCKPLTFEEELV